jgi:hypothetical protein
MTIAHTTMKRTTAMKRATLLAATVLLLTGCVSRDIRTVDMTPPAQSQVAVPEALLLDVGVALFDPGVPDDYEERIRNNIAPDVRRAESNFMALHLKNLLQSTGNWGSVRVIPRATNAVDLNVTTTIKHSEGEQLRLKVHVTDASGQSWFEKTYHEMASKYAYSDGVPADVDPFQAIYRQIADDMFEHLQQLSAEEIVRLRRLAEVRFARDFAPDAFSAHVERTRNGQFQLVRLPAEDDPMLARVRSIREREYLFIDTLDDYFTEFHAAMYPAYHDWRRATYDEAMHLRQLRAQARSRAIAGGVGIVGGIAAQFNSIDDNFTSGLVSAMGSVAIMGGAYLVQSALAKRDEAMMHANVLEELSMSAEVALVPHTIELENQTVRLTGSVEAQYEELRRILRRLYYLEMGLPEPPAPAEDDDMPAVPRSPDWQARQ